MIDKYRAELVRTLGEKRASEIQISYRAGWFTIEGAKYRRKDIEGMIARLQQRPNFTP